MQIGDTKSLMKGVIALCIIAVVLQAVNFGFYYLGRYGFSFPDNKDGLEKIFYHKLYQSFSAGMVTATMVYLAGRKKQNESKSKAAA